MLIYYNSEITNYIRHNKKTKTKIRRKNYEKHKHTKIFDDKTGSRYRDIIRILPAKNAEGGTTARHLQWQEGLNKLHCFMRTFEYT